jgi:hypothetical protein
VHKLSDRNREFDVASRLPLLHGEMLHEAQFIGRVLFRVMPFGQVISPL